MMAPAPIQHATAVALGDEEHVKVQAQRYRVRRRKLLPALAAKGFATEFSEAGLYIWCSDGSEDWAQVEWFAERGIIVTPGNFYGQGGARHIRIALTASDESIDEAIARISRD
jgi:aspartate/methionine/tyrosine aminotransferase